MGDRRERASRLLGSLFVLTGLAHLVRPGIYRGIMPPWVPAPDLMIFLSGVAELAGGLGLLLPQTRRAASIGLILLLLAVWPANFQMLFNARAGETTWWWETLLWLRLPFQVLLGWWVWKAGRPVPA